jgi:ATP-dependent Clp protease protease subunit
MLMRLSDPNRPPEIPYPFPPLREEPRRTGPVPVPLVEMPTSDPLRQLFDRRRVLVSGRLDDAAVSRLCAELMALDGRSPAAIEVLVNSGGGPLSAIGAVLDVFDLMRARVDVTCFGTAVGTAAVLVACATGERRAGRHARIGLRVEDIAAEATQADELKRRAAEHATQLHQIADRVAAATGRSADEIAGELTAGQMIDAATARQQGLIDHVVGTG